MKKKILYLLVLGGLFLVAGYLFKYSDSIHRLMKGGISNAIEENRSEPVLAKFSFNQEVAGQLLGQFFHYTVRLGDAKKWDIESDDLSRINDSIPLMITVETWGQNMKALSVDNLNEKLVKGRFDAVIKQLCTQLVGTRTNVYFRFNPEMEVPVSRYPWQQHGGSDYIGAFRYFVDLCRIYAPQAKQVWGPAGYPGTMEFYPGDDYVDAASVTIKSTSEMALKVYPSDYTVAYDLMRRLHRLRFLNKPIFVLGSQQISTDSVNNHLISQISGQIRKECEVVYSPANFKRPSLKTEAIRQNKIEIGLYDPQALLSAEKPVTVEHLFADFGNLADGTFHKSFSEVVERGHDVIVTFEPFRNPNGENDLNVLQNVTDGKYDREINQLYSIIRNTGHIVYLRYAHEMEIPITRYPWQSQDPVSYIKSFRYFMNFSDSLPSTIRRVWGPAGDRGSLEWWPGGDVVDCVSIAIYGLPDKNITDPEKQETFATIFNRKYWRLRYIDKPIFITEFGVKGPEEYQTKWLEAAAQVIRKNPQVVGVNYFNMSDTPKAWGEIKPPDWSISRKSFYRFLEALTD
jgi:beta-mannanase